MGEEVAAAIVEAVEDTTIGAEGGSCRKWRLKYSCTFTKDVLSCLYSNVDQYTQKRVGKVKSSYNSV